MKYAYLIIILLSLLCKETPKEKPPTESLRLKPVTNIKYYNLSKNGANLRAEPDTKSRILSVIPFNGEILYVQQGDYAEFDGIKDMWFEVEHKAVRGWVFGGYLSTVPANNDLSKFAGGCLREQCAVCDAIRFVPGGKIYLALGCENGHAEGKWYIEDSAIIGEITYLPDCYDSCMPKGKTANLSTEQGRKEYSKASAAYVAKHKHQVKLKFFQKPDNTFDYELISTDRKDDQAGGLPPKPIGRMRHYAVSK